jgi:hypothetical protein
MAASSSSASTSISVGYNLPVKITVCQMDAGEVAITLPLDALVLELHNNLARIKGIAPESFCLVCKNGNGEDVIMDIEQPLSAYIRVIDPVLTLVKNNIDPKIPEHQRCISCLKPFRFWATELVCEACWHQQVNAARHYGLD